MENLVINGVEYAPVSEAKTPEGLTKCVVRTYSAGVFYGEVDYESFASSDSQSLEIFNSRRIWRWYGAASLSQLAQEGVKQPDDCKIAMVEPRKLLKQVIEVTPLTPQALKSLDGVEEWKN